MKLSTIREEYYFRSGKASDICRQLGFAGIALIWVFKANTANGGGIPEALLFPGLLIIAALSLDFLQYFVGALIWGGFHRVLEFKGKTEDDDIKVWSLINNFNFIAWISKCMLIMGAYVFLVIFLVKKLS